jgi:hypothetical protein
MIATNSNAFAVKDYHKQERVSQSMLTKLSVDPFLLSDIMKQKEQEKKFEFPDFSDTPMKIGTAVDALLCLDESSMYEIFDVYPGVIPTGQMLTFCHNLYKICWQRGLEKIEDVNMDAFQAAYDNTGIKRDNFEKFVYERFAKEGKTYFEFILQAKDKEILSEKGYDMALRTAESLRNHPYTTKYITQQENVDDWAYLYQLPIYFEYKGVKCKSMLDIVRINPNEGIAQIIDIKVKEGPVSSFDYSYRKFRYDLQGAFYKLALSHWLKAEGLDLVIENPYFAVESFTSTGRPRIFQMSDIDLEVGTNGGYSLSSGKPTKGYEQLIDEYKEYLQLGSYDYPMDVRKSNGKVIVNEYTTINPATGN